MALRHVTCHRQSRASLPISDQLQCNPTDDGRPVATTENAVMKTSWNWILLGDPWDPSQQQKKEKDRWPVLERDLVV